MTRNLAVARLWLEVNSFSPVPTGKAEFGRTEWNAGEDAFRRFAGTPTEMGALAAFARHHEDWRVSVFRTAAAPPGGPMDEGMFETLLADVRAGLSSRRWDAVYLSLHGATTTPKRPTPEINLLQAVRESVGAKVPVGASFDMHANLGPSLVELADVVVGYKTLPHVDMFETGTKVLDILAETVAGRRHPVVALARPGCILHSFHMRTTDGPMREIEQVARGLETGPVLDVTPFGGFPWADGPYTGASVTAMADGDVSAARRAADACARAMAERASRFAVKLPNAAEGLARALAHAERPVVVLESGDNTYSGGIGDTPGLFRALLALSPQVPAVFAFFCAPALVERARAAGPGAELDCALGATVTDAFGPPVAVKAQVVRLTPGRFVNKGPMEAGVAVEMGPSAVLAVGPVQVIVTGVRQPVNDAAYFELPGIDPANVGLLCVKAKNHFRAAFGKTFHAFVEVDTPGPAALDLRTLPYRHADVAQAV